MISQNLEQILNRAIKRANEKRHEFLTLENVLLSMLEDETVTEVLTDSGANLQDLRADVILRKGRTRTGTKAKAAQGRKAADAGRPLQKPPAGHRGPRGDVVMFHFHK
jgi:ATP-dependent Clp protease ATP-binding subunit ClpA